MKFYSAKPGEDLCVSFLNILVKSRELESFLLVLILKFLTKHIDWLSFMQENFLNSQRSTYLGLKSCDLGLYVQAIVESEQHSSFLVFCANHYYSSPNESQERIKGR